ncbi:MAG: leucine-rich repeat domain-containing protein [Treponema sp.]|nr:leucine-rich repeat domain-containing protein [Treponema sp.]
MKSALCIIRKFSFIIMVLLLVLTFVGCKTEVEGPAGQNGVDGVSIVWLGSFASADEIKNPQPMNAYYNTTDGCSYIYDGTKWTLLAKGNYYINEANVSDSVLVLTLPNDSEEVKLTNDKAPIKVSIPEKYQITKVLWKKGNSTMSSAITLLNDASANPLVINFSNVGSFFVSENGWYDVVAQDSLGRCECNHVEVKTIDKTPLGEVKNLTAYTKDRTATVSWKDVTSTEKYNSPLKSIKISYVYNDDDTDSNNGSFLVNAGVENATITIPRAKTSEDFLRITVQTVDTVGNVSVGTNVITWCSNSVYATEENFRERLLAMTTSGEIAVVGECRPEIIGNALKELELNKPGILVDLDLSEVTGWTELAGWNSGKVMAFYGCSAINSIMLPEGITSIGNCAFQDCSNLYRITIPNSVIEIEHGAFRDCYKLSDLVLSTNLISIGYECFDTCRALEEIYIPKSVLKIGPYIFRDYNYEYLSLKIVFEDTTTVWYKTTSPLYKGGTAVGPMTNDNIEEFRQNKGYYYYSEKYQPE